VLVNNAGYSTRNRSIMTVTPEEFDEVLRVNLWAPMFFAQAVLPTMLKARSGTIINVSSRAALTPGGLGGPIYGAAKAGSVNLTKALNIELKNTGVRACCIVPGEADTPAIERRPVPPSKEARATMMAADDVADAIVLAASLPQRALVDELYIRPTHQRDFSKELPPTPRVG
jgi:NADP-dependent 3-hydroxy acid dehydrogenase YdfG